MQNLAKRLEKRGWSKREIDEALGIIKNAKASKTKEDLFLHKRIYWILLVIVATANFAISVALMPLLIALKGPVLYFVIIALGIVFGLLFELVIRSIEHLQHKHHLILAILIPLLAAIDFLIITKISNDLASKLNLNNIHSPLIVALAYALSFVMPYIVYRFVLKKGYYSSE